MEENVLLNSKIKRAIGIIFAMWPRNTKKPILEIIPGMPIKKCCILIGRGNEQAVISLAEKALNKPFLPAIIAHEIAHLYLDSDLSVPVKDQSLIHKKARQLLQRHGYKKQIYNAFMKQI